MADKTTTPHDALVSDTFSDPRHARPMLATLLPQNIVEQLDLTTLELSRDHLVDPKLHRLETDLLYRVGIRGGGEAFLYLLFEHLSSFTDRLSWRLLKYMVGIWDRWERRNPRWKKLPPIVPVVLAHVPGGWRGESELMKLFDGPEALLEALAPYLPNFRPVVVDLMRWSDEELEQLRGDALVRMVLLLLKHIRDGDIKKRLPQWSQTLSEVFRGEGFDATVRVLKYIVDCVEGLEQEDLRWVEMLPEIPSKEVLMTLGEQLREEGRREGLEKGLAQGLEKGLAQGLEKGFLEGRREGLEKGRREGELAKGRSLLGRMLRLKFGELPAWAERRLAEVDLEEIDELGERILTADTLEESLTPRK